jgi:hydroxylamine reductase
MKGGGSFMFCYQCEQTLNGQGCIKTGVCGKSPDVSALQDLLIYGLKGLSVVAIEAGKAGIYDRDIGVFTVKALFSTLTNVNFDAERFVPLIHSCVKNREELKKKITAAGHAVHLSEGAATFFPGQTIGELVAQGQAVGMQPDPSQDPDIASLKNTLIFGIKGIAAYADHAQILGREDMSVYQFCHKGLAATLNNALGLNDWLAIVMECGQVNLKTMELLDAANTEAYGQPVPIKVPLGFRKGKAILVSGHDLKDLEEVLKHSQGKGIFVYTHGEMLPAHGYPGLKKYSHLYGHYGSAWQNQHKEFVQFPGAILMTTNCLQRPLDNYNDRIFTTGLVGWPGITHIPSNNFSPVIEKALTLPGFASDEEGKSVHVGFGRSAVMNVAGAVIQAVREQKIRHFFLVAGCDGAKPGRNYYTEFVERVPGDCIVLTLACGKFRFFDKDLGDIGGIPRLLDIGQCNDAYSAIQIAIALSKAFNVDINALPLSMILSWYEQKAVAILLTLLSLGIKNIRLGPSLPAFITPNVLDVLVKNYGIQPISIPTDDLRTILGT